MNEEMLYSSMTECPNYSALNGGVDNNCDK